MTGLSTVMNQPKTTGYARQYFHSRFSYREDRDRVWREIAAYLQPYIPGDSHVLDIGAGYCNFINHVNAAKRYALDIYPEFTQYAQPDVTTFVANCENLSMFDSETLDVIFASNLLEHLSRGAIDSILTEIQRVLKTSGRLILIQPNYRYCYREYFDDYTHVQVFTHVSLSDLLQARGFQIEKIVPRFLPYTFVSRLPKWPWLVRLYLRLPFRPLGKQMLLISRKSSSANSGSF